MFDNFVQGRIETAIAKKCIAAPKIFPKSARAYHRSNIHTQKHDDQNNQQATFQCTHKGLREKEDWDTPKSCSKSESVVVVYSLIVSTLRFSESVTDLNLDGRGLSFLEK